MSETEIASKNIETEEPRSHSIKTWDVFMYDIAIGKKTFEVRKNDRDYKEGDILLLEGWDNEQGMFTGKAIVSSVTYILHGGRFGIEEGYCVMGIKVLDYNF